MATTEQLPSAFDLFGKSKDLIMKNVNTFALLYLLPLLFTLGDISTRNRVTEDDINGWQDRLSGLSTAGMIGLVGFGLGLLIVTFLASLIIQTMLNVLELQAAQGKKPTLGAVWDVAKKYLFRWFGLSILTGLAIIGGFILLIVPGLIMIRRYFLAPYYLIDRDMGILDAMRASARDSKPVSGSIWGIIGVFILIGLVGIIPVVGPIISLGLTVLYSVAPALRYQQIKSLNKA